MDTRKLPLSLLVALGLAPGGCDDLGCVARPCLNIAEPQPPPGDTKGEPSDTKGEPADTKGEPSDTKGGGKVDPPIGPCLMVRPDPTAGPCLDVSPPPRPGPEPPVTPCLEFMACLQPMPDPDPATDPPKQKCLSAAPRRPKGKASDGGMARADVIDRVLQRDVLPPDVASRLRREPDDA